MPVGADETFSYALRLGPTGRRKPVRRTQQPRRDRRHVALVEGPRRAPPSGIMCEYEGGISFFPIPFGAKFVQHPGREGVMYSAVADVYRIAVTPRRCRYPAGDRAHSADRAHLGRGMGRRE